MANNFLPFCPTDSGTNLDTQGAYAVATDRTSGNQPGVARSKLVNKALRQANYIASQVAQYLADKTGTDLLDDAIPAKLLSQINASILPLQPNYRKYLAGSTTFNSQYYFFIASGSATVGATYTNNTVTYTVVATVASGLQIKMTGNGAPTASGTLTKASGTGDSTLTFYAMRAPLYMRVRLVGPGGGGAGITGNGAAGSVATTFGTALLSGSAGAGATAGGGGGGAGGAASLGTGPVGVALSGATGNGSGGTGATQEGSGGGGSPYGGAGEGAVNSGAGGVAKANTGSGGGGAGTVGGGEVPGSGGGSGGWLDALITTLLSTYAVVVGAGGAGGSGTQAGGAGADGLCEAWEHYQ